MYQCSNLNRGLKPLDTELIFEPNSTGDKSQKKSKSIKKLKIAKNQTFFNMNECPFVKIVGFDRFLDILIFNILYVIYISHQTYYFTVSL
jgi:hypothetical protein